MQGSQDIGRLVASVTESPLTPLSFLSRSAYVWQDCVAVCEGDRRWTYGEHHDRVRRAASALTQELGIRPGDRVAALLPNVAAMLELHYAVPGAGGVLVPLNTRLAADDYAYILDHSGAEIVIADEARREVLGAALGRLRRTPRVLWTDSTAQGYDAMLAGVRPMDLAAPDDEQELLSINYTSGTTGRPRGVMTCHRGAYLHSLGVIAEARLTQRSIYLWTLPMFHCNGWAYTWAVTAAGARHVCLPSSDPDEIWQALREEGVTEFCAAPTVVSMMLASPQAAPSEQAVRLYVGGAPPAPTLLQRADELNIEMTHLYGLTETYGPIAVCAWKPAWNTLAADDQARLKARQGVATIVSERLRVVTPEMQDVPADGTTPGEVVMRGNNVMRGYYRDPGATKEAFRGGWFHSGDIGVVHPDGYIELRDRLKDVIVSGGENIASIEVEQALMEHPRVDEAAVVGSPDDRWGEIVVGFVTTRGSDPPDPDELRQFVRERIAHFKAPKRIEIVDELPKTATGKIRKFMLRDDL